MARIRYIKPDFFVDPELCELPYQHRLIFAGLWCYADRAGRLKCEPKKLKTQIMPYDSVNMIKILNELTIKPFIYIYMIEGISYIQIINWNEHQNPHHTEKISSIPSFNGLLTVSKPSANFDEAISSHSHISSNIGININTYDFNYIWTKYPRKLGKDEALKNFNAQVITDKDYQDIKIAIEKFNNSSIAKGDPQFIPYGSTWFNKNWRDWVTYKENATIELSDPDHNCKECKGDINHKIFAQGTGISKPCWCRRK